MGLPPALLPSSSSSLSLVSFILPLTWESSSISPLFFSAISEVVDMYSS